MALEASRDGEHAGACDDPWSDARTIAELGTRAVARSGSNPPEDSSLEMGLPLEAEQRRRTEEYGAATKRRRHAQQVARFLGKRQPLVPIRSGEVESFIRATTGGEQRRQAPFLMTPFRALTAQHAEDKDKVVAAESADGVTASKKGASSSSGSSSSSSRNMPGLMLPAAVPDALGGPAPVVEASPTSGGVSSLRGLSQRMRTRGGHQAAHTCSLRSGASAVRSSLDRASTAAPGSEEEDLDAVCQAAIEALRLPKAAERPAQAPDLAGDGPAATVAVARQRHKSMVRSFFGGFARAATAAPRPAIAPPSRDEAARLPPRKPVLAEAEGLVSRTALRAALTAASAVSLKRGRRPSPVLPSVAAASAEEAPCRTTSCTSAHPAALHEEAALVNPCWRHDPPAQLVHGFASHLPQGGLVYPRHSLVCPSAHL